MPTPSERSLLSYVEGTEYNEARNAAIRRAIDDAVVEAMNRMPAFFASSLPLPQSLEQFEVVDGCDCPYCLAMRDLAARLTPPRPRRILEVPSNLSARAIERLRARRDIELRFVDPKPVAACPAGYEGEDD